MPLLHKNPFVPNEFPPGLQDNEEVFFCALTREIFRDYELFCERIILCNSLVWSCSLTGRSHLTYQEAAASEDKIKRLLKRFPMELRIPVLYLASLCERKSLIELAEDVFSFVKDRYFIGETVYVSLPSKEDKHETVQCHVLAVNAPSKEEIEKYEQENPKNGERFHWIPACLYKYEVERMDNGEEAEATADMVSRKKSSYTKDKNRLYIKQFVHMDNGLWKLKETSNTKYGISKVKFDQIFCGQAPNMNARRTNNSLEKKKSGSKKQETINKSGNKLSPGMKASVEAKRKAREEKKENKRNLAEFLREWSLKREDLECEDLKALPTPVRIESRLPNEYFGEAVMFMEFIHSFRTVLPVKDFFPHGVTFDVVERALVDNEFNGPLSDLLQLLLVSVFDLQEEESDEIKETDVKITPGLIFTRGDVDTIKVVKAATASDSWTRKYHTVAVSQLPIDPSTVSEVLRLHLLTSGAIPTKSKIAKWRYQARGGYCNNDDPAVTLKLKRPQLIEKLGQITFFEFNVEEKLAVLNCLMEQIITYSSLRDVVEEGCEKARLARIELRAVRAAEVKKEKEEALRLKAEKKNGIVQSAPPPDVKKTPREIRELRSINEKRDLPELLAEIRQALAGAQLLPLGSDSALRRYWIFSSVPGLFVEEGEENPGPCIPNGTPYFYGPENEDHLAYIRRLFEESSKDKENLLGKGNRPHSISPSKRHLLSEKNNGTLQNPQLNGDKVDLHRRVGLVCTGDNDSCPVHGPNRQKSWSYFSDPEEVEKLIEGLNRRGFREKRLKQTLSQEKNTILERLTSCPADKYNYVIIPPNAKCFTEHQNKSMKTYDQANTTHPQGTPLDSIMEGNLRELILEVEDKIYVGAVGSLKVKSREAWRDAIRNFTYDQQCKKLTWARKGSDYDMEIDDPMPEIKEEHQDDEIKKEVDEEESRASTPSIDETCPITNSAAWPGINNVPQRPVVADMASAILQLGQAIEAKYLKRPLGLDQKEKDEKKKEKDKDVSDLKNQTPTMDRWEEGLMSSTNFPQLFLYLSTLDNSVCWEKSALHASCRICRRKKDPESMLLCDTCNKGHHLYCLKPKLTKVPAGDWHCPKCRPKEKQVSPVKNKKRRLFSDDSDGEEAIEEHECKTCGEKGAQLECGTCEIRLHLNCVNPPMRRVPKSNWFCHDCRNANSLIVNTSRKSNGAVEVKVEEEEETKEEVKSTKVQSTPKSRSSEASRRKESKEPEKKETPPAKTSSSRLRIKMNGHLNGDIKSGESGSEEEEDEEVTTPSMSDRSRRDRRSNRRSDARKGRDLPLDNAALQEILDVLMHHPEAPPFLRPVARSEAPDYHEIIKKPMDFGTIKHKLNMLFYKKNSDLIADAELLFNNCCLYNDESTDIYKAGEELRTLFYKLCREHNLLEGEIMDCDGVKPAKRARLEL